MTGVRRDGENRSDHGHLSSQKVLPQPGSIKKQAGPDTTHVSAADPLSSVFTSRISFSFSRKTPVHIVRNISSSLNTDLALSPAVYRDQQNNRNVYSLDASGLNVSVVLDWCARLMGCVYMEDDAPDIWFLYENSWVKNAECVWGVYPAFLLDPSENGEPARRMITSLQKGLSWQRTDITVREGAQPGRLLVNSTEAGHRRLTRLFETCMDRNFIQFENVIVHEQCDLSSGLSGHVRCSGNRSTVSRCIQDITQQTGMNIGYNSALGKADDTEIPVPLEIYTVRELLRKIIENSDYSEYHYEDSNAVWLSHSKEEPFYRPRYMAWESLDVYIIGITSIAKFLKGKDIVAAVKREVHPRSWAEPSMVITYFKPCDILIIINRAETVKETIRFLKTVKKFRTLNRRDNVSGFLQIPRMEGKE